MKNCFKLVLLVQLILVGCGSSQKDEASKKKMALIHYTHGTEALIKKDYTTALDHLIKSDRFQPNQTKTLNNLGMAYFFKKETTTAIKILLKSIKADGKNTDARVNLASVYYQIGRLNKAEESFKIVLRDLVYQHQYRTYHNIALIELKRGNYDMAISAFKKSVEIKDDYCPSNFKLGNLAYRRFDYQSALKYYRDATKGNCYNLADPHLKQAEALIQLKKYTEARLKLTDIKNQFRGTRFDTLAKVKLNDLDNLEKQEFYSNKKQTINNFYNK